MDRRKFLKIALAASGVAVAGYVGLNVLETSKSSVQSLGNYQLTTAMSSNWHIPHLLRRVGFGGSPSEQKYYESLGFTGALDHLLNYENIDASSLPSQPNITMAYTTQPSPSETYELVSWWVDRMVKTPRPLEEKMALFWHNHFATAIYKVRSPYLMFKQNQLLRTKAMGSFEELLMGVTEDPAMLIWLDGAKNRKGAANENYGREVMEVFTTGRGNYGEDDVKAAARAFTGYTLDKNANVTFNPRFHDDTSKTFLGHTGNLAPQDIVHILATHPATAKRLAYQLFQYFAYDNPSNDIIDKLTKTYTDTNGNIKAVVGAILNSDEFISQQAYLAQVKSPVEYVATSLRSLGATIAPTTLAAALNNMGQLPFDPPSVFGWPTGLGWISSATVIDRINFPLAIQPSASLQSTLPGPVSETQTNSYVANVGRVLFPEGLPEEVVQSISNSTTALTSALDKAKNALRLTMASPFYNLN